VGAQGAAIVAGEHAGGLGVGQQVGALSAQQVGDGLRVAQGDAEQGVADGVVAKAAVAQVGQRLGVGRIAQEAVRPEGDGGVDLAVVVLVGCGGGGAGVAGAARRAQADARARVVAKQLGKRPLGVAGLDPRFVSPAALSENV
jgi:hypothetical protein